MKMTSEQVDVFLKPYHDRNEQASYSDDSYYKVPNTPPCRSDLERVEQVRGVYNIYFTIPDKHFVEGGEEYIEVRTSYRIGD